MFRAVPLSIIRSFSLYTQQWYMPYMFADSLRAGSRRNWFRPDPAQSSVLILLARWWTEELSETCRVLFQK